jgi:hypothetical protein
VDVPEYEKAKPDVLAQEIPTILSRLNVDRQADLHLLAKQFLLLEFVRACCVIPGGIPTTECLIRRWMKCVSRRWTG